MFDADQDLGGEEVFVAQQDENVVEKEVDPDQIQDKAKGYVFHEPEDSTTTTSTIPKSKSQDKGKAKMIEEPVKLKKKDQIQLDEEVALKLQAELQAEFEKEQRLAKVIEGISKRAGTKLEQESAKKQKIDDDKYTTELQQLVKVILDEERVAIDVIPLAVKPPSIVD
nr:hypothetical protein [Tanacetum cinerariifolium]